MAKQTLIKWTAASRGIDHVRQITEKDWERLGIAGAPNAVWSRANGFVVDATKWPLQAIEVLRESPAEFRIIENGSGEQQENPAQEAPASHENPGTK